MRNATLKLHAVLIPQAIVHAYHPAVAQDWLKGVLALHGFDYVQIINYPLFCVAYPVSEMTYIAAREAALSKHDAFSIGVVASSLEHHRRLNRARASPPPPEWTCRAS